MLGVYADEAFRQTDAQWGGYVSILWLKKLFEKYLSRTNELEEATDDDEEAEKDLTRDYYSRAFMLFLVGCMILSDKSNKHIKVMRLEGMRNLSRVHEWSWGGMALANVYHQLFEVTDLRKNSIVGYT